MPHTVAIVEDDAPLRERLAQAVRGAPDLTLAGVAGDLPAGLSLLRSARPAVLLVDLDLPSGSGIDLIRTAAAELPGCEVMVYTLFGDERHVVQALEAGASGYLLKDLPQTDIAEHIRVLCAGGSPINPSIARRLLARFHPGSTATPHAGSGSRLSAQEQGVLALCAKGYTYTEIARLLRLSEHTVRTYVKRIYRKLQVHGRTEAVYEARKLKWLVD